MLHVASIQGAPCQQLTGITGDKRLNVATLIPDIGHEREGEVARRAIFRPDISIEDECGCELAATAEIFDPRRFEARENIVCEPDRTVTIKLSDKGERGKRPQITLSEGSAAMTCSSSCPNPVRLAPRKKVDPFNNLITHMPDRIASKGVNQDPQFRIGDFVKSTKEHKSRSR